jgi:hypothetical protein
MNMETDNGLTNQSQPSDASLPTPSYANMVAPASSPLLAARSSTPLRPTETDRLNRTQIIRRTNYGMTGKDIIRTMTAQMGMSAGRLFESVLRDPRDNRRYYLTYRTFDIKRHVSGRGFTLGSVVIRPTDDTTEGYIPYPPYYIDKQSLDTLLTEYGDVVRSAFTTTDDGVRVAGYSFAIRLKRTKTLPDVITYNDCEMTIRLKDDLRTCTYCKRTGHTTGLCRQRKADDVIFQKKRKDAREDQQTLYNADITSINIEEVDALEELDAQYATEMDRLAGIHRNAVDEMEAAEVSEPKLLLLHADFRNRQSEEAHNHDEYEADIRVQAAQRRAEAVTEFSRMGFRPPHKPVGTALPRGNTRTAEWKDIHRNEELDLQRMMDQRSEKRKRDEEVAANKRAATQTAATSVEVVVVTTVAKPAITARPVAAPVVVPATEPEVMEVVESPAPTDPAIPPVPSAAPVSLNIIDHMTQELNRQNIALQRQSTPRTFVYFKAVSSFVKLDVSTLRCSARQHGSGHPANHLKTIKMLYNETHKTWLFKVPSEGEAQIHSWLMQLTAAQQLASFVRFSGDPSSLPQLPWQ